MSSMNEYDRLGLLLRNTQILIDFLESFMIFNISFIW